MSPYDVINDAVRRLNLDRYIGGTVDRDAWLAWVYLMRVSSHFNH